MNKLELLGYSVWDSLLPDNLFNYRIINTLNAHSYCVAKENAIFKAALQASDILLPDGISIVLAAAIFYGKRIHKIAGNDLHQHILQKLQLENGSCFYLGSSNATLDLIAKRIQKEYPAIRVRSHAPPFTREFSDEDNRLMIEAINCFNPDVVFVGMTAPKQEKWVYENQARIKAKTICSIGAVFDYYAGTIKRAGTFWIYIGLEFLPRLIKEPRRLWRRTFISSPHFMYDIFLNRLRRIK